MNIDLSPIEIRVLCSLIEKESTTPDQYPLSTNALRNACNQKTSRDPVADYSESDIDAAVLSLREQGLARSLRPSGSRTWKHRHVIEEVLPLSTGERAILAVLGLRGAQTAGELRSRTERIHEFDGAEDVDDVLTALAARDQSLVANIGREPGQSQDRWEHRLGSGGPSPALGAQRNAAADFAALHESGFFAMANPWDVSSARLMERVGAKALATSSAAFADVMGKQDYGISRDELVAHVKELVDCVSVPISVDGEQLFPNEPGGIAQTVALLARAGAAGVSIEDFDPRTERVVPLEQAVAAVREAAQACAAHHVLLTARYEGYLYGNEDLDELISRLQAYETAGADCLYAPGLAEAGDIELVLSEISKPLSVLSVPGGPSTVVLADLGVRRATAGSSLYREVHETMTRLTRSFLGAEPQGETP